MANKYLEPRGVNQNLLGGYSFTEDASKKYLNGGVMDKEAGLSNVIGGIKANIKNVLTSGIKKDIAPVADAAKIFIEPRKAKSIVAAPISILRPGQGFRPLMPSRVKVAAYTDELQKIALSDEMASAFQKAQGKGIFQNIKYPKGYVAPEVAAPTAIVKVPQEAASTAKAVFNKIKGNKALKFGLAGAGVVGAGLVAKKLLSDKGVEKTAARNYVAQYGIKGGTAGAGIGSATAGAATYAALKKLTKSLPKLPKSPIIAATMIAGAVAGAEAGGRMGAYMGGGHKGTHGMFEEPRIH
jgi:hypothetical protein